MYDYEESERSGRKILDLLSNIMLSPTMVAKVLANANGPMRIRVWQVVKAIIVMWEIDIKHEQVSAEHREIYEWVKGLNNGRG